MITARHSETVQQDINWLLQEKHHGHKTEAFYADCARLQQGEPLAYIIGHVPFLDTTIQLDSRPLIPRTETEYWTLLAIDHLKKTAPSTTLHLLDLCAGSGCIGVAIAHALPNTHVTFVELDPAHANTIAVNCRHNNLSTDRYRIYTGNLFYPLPANQRYDYIVTNPPYIDPELDRTTPAVRDFEPHEALYGGPSGLALITRIIANAPQRLTTAGQLWIEHEPEQVAHLPQLTPPTLHLAGTHKDQYERPRVSVWTMAI